MIPTDNHQPLNAIASALAGERGPDQQRIAAVAVEWATTLLAKNQDYGGSAWQRPLLAPELDAGEAIMVRMSDKLARIAQLRQRDDGPAVEDESLRDTVADLGAYALLWLARPDGERA